jgi:hypothetical protein
MNMDTLLGLDFLAVPPGVYKAKITTTRAVRDGVVLRLRVLEGQGWEGREGDVHFGVNDDEETKRRLKTMLAAVGNPPEALEGVVLVTPETVEDKTAWILARRGSVDFLTESMLADVLVDYPPIWTFDAKHRTLTHAVERYEVDLDRAGRSAAASLDWIAQVAGKAWATPQDVGALVCAMDVALEFQANLCGNAM